MTTLPTTWEHGRCERCARATLVAYVALVGSTGTNGDSRIERWGWACRDCLRMPASAA